jgi:hypothetical protein
MIRTSSPDETRTEVCRFVATSALGHAAEVAIYTAEPSLLCPEQFMNSLLSH